MSSHSGWFSRASSVSACGHPLCLSGWACIISGRALPALHLYPMSPSTTLGGGSSYFPPPASAWASFGSPLPHLLVHPTGLCRLYPSSLILAFRLVRCAAEKRTAAPFRRLPPAPIKLRRCFPCPIFLSGEALLLHLLRCGSSSCSSTGTPPLPRCFSFCSPYTPCHCIPA